MDRRLNFFESGFSRDRESKLGDQFCRLGADDVCVQDLAVWLADNNLYEAFRFADSQRFAVR